MRETGFDKKDIAKEIIWGFIVAVLAYLYWLLVFAIITFVFNSYLDIHYTTILWVCVGLTFITMLFHIRKVLKNWKSRH